jgi:hypothetical protein
VRLLKGESFDPEKPSASGSLAKLGELTMANQLLCEKIDRLEADHPWARRRSRR